MSSPRPTTDTQTPAFDGETTTVMPGITFRSIAERMALARVTGDHDQYERGLGDARVLAATLAGDQRITAEHTVAALRGVLHAALDTIGAGPVGTIRDVGW